MYIVDVLSAERIPGDRVKIVTDTIMKLQEFVNNMQRVQVDNTEYAYLKTLALFSPGKSHTCLSQLVYHIISKSKGTNL